MKRATPLRLVCVLVPLLLIGGCGGDAEPMSPAEYFAGVEAAMEVFDERNARVEEVVTAQDPIESGRQIFQLGLDYSAALVDEMEDLVPPETAAAVHAEMVAAIGDVIAASRALIAEMEDVDTLAGLTELGNREVFDALTEASRRFNSACLGLQEAAGAAGVGVDLLCS